MRTRLSAIAAVLTVLSILLQCAPASAAKAPKPRRPLVVVHAPATAQGTVAIDVVATDRGGGGIATVELYLNGVLLESYSTATATYTWDSTAVDNGTYRFRAVATDNAGRVGKSRVTVTVANSTTPGPVEVTPESFVTALYQDLLGRPPDPEGFDFWVDSIRQGASFEDVRQQFLGSEEYAQKHGDSGDRPPPSPPAQPTPFTVSVSGPSVVASNVEMAAGWADGLLGLTPEGNAWRVIGPTLIPVTYVGGTLTRPTAGATPIDHSIAGISPGYAYTAGGPVWVVSPSLRIMIVHGERWPNGNAAPFKSYLHMAKSTDGGNSWTDLGMIISVNTPFDPTSESTPGNDIGGGPFVIREADGEQYMYLYYPEFVGPVGQHVGRPFSVARCRTADIIAAANANQAPLFWKYLNGEFNSPGLGGNSNSGLSPWIHSNIWFDVTFNSYVGKYLLIAFQNGRAGQMREIRLFESDDGIQWTQRDDVLTPESGENFYATFVSPSDGNQSRTTGQVFDIYYTNSAIGGFQRWTDQRLMRRTLTLTRI